MNYLHVILLAIIQGFAELLPVSSSAHVIVAEKLLGLDPSAPEMTFLLVMLHTGTMFAVLLYFWSRWKVRWTEARGNWIQFLKSIFIATVLTGVFGLILKKIIEKAFLQGQANEEIEALFSYLPLMAASLFAAGILILVAGTRKFKETQDKVMTTRTSALIGAVQGLCLPFRGFSRSGATISTAMMVGVSKTLAEDFSFALAVVLTPPVVLRELLRLVKAHVLDSTAGSIQLFMPGLVGMVFSFMAGMLALRWLSSWIEQGRWKWFGYYCIAASIAILLFLR